MDCRVEQSDKVAPSEYDGDNVKLFVSRQYMMAFIVIAKTQSVPIYK